MCLVSVLLCFYSCKKFIIIDPPANEISRENVFGTENSAISAITGIYSEMKVNPVFIDGASNGISNLCGLASDELQGFPPGEFELNQLTPMNSSLLGMYWEPAFKYIWYANSVLEGLQNSSINEGVKEQLVGEAKFVRAFCNFYLANLFGDIPLVTTTDYRVNSIIGKSSVNEMYSAIIDDLLEAQLLLDDDYPTSERTRPNKAAASAMLARAYLYTEQWDKAELVSTEVINNTVYALVEDLNRVFVSSSSEVIWQLMPVMPGLNTYDANYFLFAGNNGLMRLTDNLMNAFEEGDFRKTHWLGIYENEEAVDAYYPYKYKIGEYYRPVEEFMVVFRLAEMYLIRAESRANQEDILGAVEDINVLRVRAGLAPLNLSAKDEVLDAIFQERRIEFFAEWGHRWFDLKRSGRIDQVLGEAKANWRPTAALFPIPQSEIEKNGNLLPQNPGY